MEPNFDFAIVAFLDFLGFRVMVDEDAASDTPQHLPAILDALRLADQKIDEAGFELVQFSDSIIITAPFEPANAAELLITVAELQRLLIARGITIRGGVAFGHHHARNGRLYSKALVNAYELESKRAQFPRVIVDGNLIDWCLNHNETDDTTKDAFRSQVLLDRDGEAFVHYLDKDLMEAHELIVENTVQAGEKGQPSVLSKAHWLIDYHQHIADEIGHSGLSNTLSQRFNTLQ